MRIGDIKLKSCVVMAPIAGMTDGPFRKIVMEHGAGMVTTELLSANAIVRNSAKTIKMFPAMDEPRPVAAQIFGADPLVMREAALIVENTSCDLIDLNFGCPVKKVTRCGAGAALLKDIDLAGRVVKEVASAVKKPVTVKIRTGWDSGSINTVELAKRLQGEGAQAIAIHARTAVQSYSGEADWGIIRDVAEAIPIPVIGNGDITSPEKAIERLDTSGCAGVMIGRAALGAPWIFREVNDLKEKGVYNTLSLKEKGDIIAGHIEMMVDHYGERIGIKKMRTRLGYYSRGVRGGAKFREAVNKTNSLDALRDLTTQFFIENKTAVLF